MGAKRSWTIEDNVVALYIALYGYDGLGLDKNDIESLIGHPSLQMRVQNYRAIETRGSKGLTAGLKSPTFNKLYRLFKPCDRKWFTDYVNLILETRRKLK